MKTFLQDRLFDSYPDLFQQRHLPMTQTCMCWGIDCEDGWFNIIDKACKDIVEADPNAQMTQVKEKYGSLRLYLDGNEKAQDIAGKAETASYETCELCGNPGKPNEYGWIKTLCEGCRENG